MQTQHSRKFPRSLRLTDSTVYRDVFDRGESRAGKLVVLWTADTQDAGRFGVVVSKRTFPKASMRSRAKRLMREACRLNSDRFRKDRNVVLIGRRAITNAQRQEVEAELLELADKSGILLETNN